VSPCRQASATNPQRIASAGSGPAGRDRRQTPVAVPSSTTAPLSTTPLSAKSAIVPDPHPAVASHARDWRLHKHADYQRVYQASRKQFSTLLTYFVAAQPAGIAGAGPRVGITAGKVLGKAVERNRIKRRMRAAIVSNLEALHVDVDLVLHPKRNVLDAEWTALVSDVRRVFEKVQRASVTRENGNAESGAGERRA
jgi:ribonuclease P protein component